MAANEPSSRRRSIVTLISGIGGRLDQFERRHQDQQAGDLGEGPPVVISADRIQQVLTVGSFKKLTCELKVTPAVIRLAEVRVLNSRTNPAIPRPAAVRDIAAAGPWTATGRQAAITRIARHDGVKRGQVAARWVAVARIRQNGAAKTRRRVAILRRANGRRRVVFALQTQSTFRAVGVLRAAVKLANLTGLTIDRPSARHRALIGSSRVAQTPHPQ